MPRGEATPQGAVPRCLRLPCPGVGGPASPGSSAAEIGESPEEGGEGARPSCGRKPPFPSFPPSRGALAFPGPSSREASSLAQPTGSCSEAGTGGLVMEKIPAIGAHGRRRALDSGGGAPARALRQDPGSAPAACRGKCATGWGEKSQVQPPEPAGLKREHPKDA